MYTTSPILPVARCRRCPQGGFAGPSLVLCFRSQCPLDRRRQWPKTISSGCMQSELAAWRMPSDVSPRGSDPSAVRPTESQPAPVARYPLPVTGSMTTGTSMEGIPFFTVPVTILFVSQRGGNRASGGSLSGETRARGRGHSTSHCVWRPGAAGRRQTGKQSSSRRRGGQIRAERHPALTRRTSPSCRPSAPATTRPMPSAAMMTCVIQTDRWRRAPNRGATPDR